MAENVQIFRQADGVDPRNLWIIVAAAGYHVEADAISSVWKELWESGPLYVARACARDISGFQKMFLYACDSNSMAKIEGLLPHATNRNLMTAAFGPEKRTGIQLATLNGHTELVTRLLSVAPHSWRLGDASGQTALHLACGHNLPAMVRLFLTHPSIDINVQDHSGRTPLMVAARAGHAKLVSWMLSTLEGVNIEQADSNGETLLIHAICSGDGATMYAVLAHGAALDAAARYKEAWTLLHYACRYGNAAAVQHLLAAGADVNARTATMETALMLVCEGGHVPTLTVLAGHIQLHGIEEPEEAGNRHNWRAVHFAAAAGHVAILQKLVDYFKRAPSGRFVSGLVSIDLHENAEWMLAENTHSSTPLMLACKHGRAEAIKFLLEDANRSKPTSLDDATATEWPLLHWCCEQGYTEAVRVLASPWGLDHGMRLYLNKQAKLSEDDFDFNRQPSPLEAIARSPLAVALFGPAAAEIAPVLHAAGASVMDVTAEGHSALTLAVASGNLEAVKALVAVGVDINAKDGLGHSALATAVQYVHDAVLSWLLDQPGIDIRTKTTEEGASLLHVACWSPPHIPALELLLNRPGSELDVNAVDLDGRTPLLSALNSVQAGAAVKILLAHPLVDLTAKDARGRSAMHTAVGNSCPEALQALLDHGLSLTSYVKEQFPDAKGDTFLHVAAAVRNTLAVHALLDAGAEIDARGREQLTPLMRAACLAGPIADDDSTAAALLDKGADPSLTDDRGWNAVAYAVISGSVACVNLFHERGVLDPTWADESGLTLAHFAASIDGEDGEDTVARASSMIERLNELGVDWSALEADRLTPFLLAATQGHLSALEVLCAHANGGVLDLDVNATNDQGQTALMLVAGRTLPARGCLISMLNYQQLDVAISDSNSETAMVYAVRTGAIEADVGPSRFGILNRFAQRGAIQPAAKYGQGKTLLHVAAAAGCKATTAYLLAQATVDVNAVDEKGRTPLMLALYGGHSHIAKMLLDTHKVDISVQDLSGKNTLMYSCCKDGPSWGGIDFTAAVEPNVIRRLIELGGPDSVNHRAADGHTAFTLACRQGHRPTIQALFETTGLNGEPPEVEMAGPGGRHALVWACTSGQLAAVKWLVSQDKILALDPPADEEEEEDRVDAVAYCLMKVSSSSAAGAQRGAPQLNALLAEAIARARPRTLEQLRAVTDMTEDLVQSSGQELVGFLAAVLPKLRLGA